MRCWRSVVLSLTLLEVVFTREKTSLHPLMIENGIIMVVEAADVPDVEMGALMNMVTTSVVGIMHGIIEVSPLATPEGMAVARTMMEPTAVATTGEEVALALDLMEAQAMVEGLTREPIEEEDTAADHMETVGLAEVASIPKRDMATALALANEDIRRVRRGADPTTAPRQVSTEVGTVNRWMITEAAIRHLQQVVVGTAIVEIEMNIAGGTTMMTTIAMMDTAGVASTVAIGVVLRVGEHGMLLLEHRLNTAPDDKYTTIPSSSFIRNHFCRFTAPRGLWYDPVWDSQAMGE